VKFVVTGAPRTGTTMFLIALDTVENFNVYGEVLVATSKNPTKHPQAAVENFRIKNVKTMQKRTSKTMEQFVEWLYKTGDNVGFKFLYQHAERFPDVRKYIKRDEIYKIHLMRKNPVKRMVSGLLNRYHHYGEGTNNVKPPVVLAGIKRAEGWDRKLERMFQCERYMKMYYEDLTKDTNTNILDFTEVFNFFGVSDNPMVKVPTKKYGPDKLIDRVGNYDKLYEYFKKEAPEYLKYVEE